MFTWIPIYKELAEKIMDFENRQAELLQIMKDLGKNGLKTIALKDKAVGDVDTELKEIDPFTFFAAFNRGLTEKNRMDILSFLKDHFSLTCEVPEDFNGIPIVQPNRSWFFAYEKDRGKNDIELLWKLGIQAVKTNAIDKTLFDDCLKIKEVGLPLLTMGLFWVAPHAFLPADGNTREYLKKSGIEMKEWDYNNYANYLEAAKKRLVDDFPQISYDAWLKNYSQTQLPPLGIRYWQIAPANKARLWPQMSKEGYIGVGWDGSPDLSGVETEEELFSVLKKAGQGETKQKTQSHQLWNFLKNVKIGDIVVANHGKSKIVGVGKVTGDYYFDISKSEYRHCKKVNWEWLGEKEIPTQNKFGKTIVELTKKEFESLIEGLSLKSFWIFQANPEFYDLTSAISELNQMEWEVNQHHEAIHRGDVAFLWESGKDAGIVAIATVQSEPHESTLDVKEEKFVKDKTKFAGSKMNVQISIDKVLSTCIRRKELIANEKLKSLSILKFSSGTNFRVKPEEADVILALIRNKSQIKINQNWLYIVERKGQAIFYGPPGTGKTFFVKQLATACVDKVSDDNVIDENKKRIDRIEFITFHPAYSYDEFIEGITVATEAEGVPCKDLQYQLKPGIFKELCKKALAAITNDTANGKTWKEIYNKFKDKEEAIDLESTPKFVLIIDEINRGDIAKIFGELITLLEADKRIGAENEIIVKLPLSGDDFGVPPNLYIVGTMNTADRSIALLDVALRRRFGFIEMNPDFDALEREHIERRKKLLEKNGVYDLLKKSVYAIKNINEQLCQDKSIGRDRQIGHSFLFKVLTIEDLRLVWRHEIMPLMEEYCYGDYEKINKMLYGKDESTDWLSVSEGIKPIDDLNTMLDTIINHE